jgi:uncharacterized damage-inducible protein DinB
MPSFFKALADEYRELHGEIRRNLEALPLEALDWKHGAEMNSVSVMIVHLTGAERFWVGDVVMRDPSNRDREAEFKVSGMSKADLIQRLNSTEAYLTSALEKLSLSDLESERTHPRHDGQVSVAYALLHALDHVATHVGHIQLSVQMWQQRPAGEG